MNVFEVKYPKSERLSAEKMGDKKLKRELAKIIRPDLKLSDNHNLAVRFNKAKEEKNRGELENLYNELIGEKENKIDIRV